MRDFELASLVVIIWTLLYDFSLSRSRATNIMGVEDLDEKTKYSFKLGPDGLSWLKIDFFDDYHPEHFHIFSVGDMQFHKFEVVHTYDHYNKITFELEKHEYFKIEDNKGHKFLAYLDKRDDNKVIIEVLDHTLAKWTYEVRAQ
jgi:hypothetical protein